MNSDSVCSDNVWSVNDCNPIFQTKFFTILVMTYVISLYAGTKQNITLNKILTDIQAAVINWLMKLETTGSREF